MEHSLEITGLSPDPVESWRNTLRFVGLNHGDKAAMAASVEPLLKNSADLVIHTYEYLRSFPETAAILGWESGVDEEHLEERRRFFSIWLARTIAVDTSDEFAYYLFRAGKYHAGHGPRRIHTPPVYVTSSIGLMLAAFSRYLGEAGLSADLIANAMAGWSKYLTVQLNQMHAGYQCAIEFERGEIPVRLSVYGRMRSVLEGKEFTLHADKGEKVVDLLRKFFNYFPQARAETLERTWRSEEKEDSLWVEVKPVYRPLPGWRILLNGRDLVFEGGFQKVVHKDDEMAIFPPGR